jgi:hypothetical protein
MLVLMDFFLRDPKSVSRFLEKNKEHLQNEEMIEVASNDGKQILIMIFHPRESLMRCMSLRSDGIRVK